jgi:hypothetical protein
MKCYSVCSRGNADYSFNFTIGYELSWTLNWVQYHHGRVSGKLFIWAQDLSEKEESDMWIVSEFLFQSNDAIWNKLKEFIMTKR